MRFRASGSDAKPQFGPMGTKLQCHEISFGSVEFLWGFRTLLS